MTKSINPLLKPENRKEFIKQAMRAMSDRQGEVIKQADKIIGDVVRFEESVHQKYVSYIGSH
jgi:phage shock protein A